MGGSNLIMQVVFQLHASFDNPMREYTHPPYELTETGWGEFEIAVLVRCSILIAKSVRFLRTLLTCVFVALQLHFTDDAFEEPVELYHKLKLYGEDDPSGQASTKKPVSDNCNMPQLHFFQLNNLQSCAHKPVYLSRLVALSILTSFSIRIAAST